MESFYIPFTKKQNKSSIFPLYIFLRFCYNETLIQSALSRLIRDKTVLIIAHRMRTVAGADKIVVLSEGSVAECGTPEELLGKDGIYAHMVRIQTENQEWALE